MSADKNLISVGTPVAELLIDESLVRHLLAEQHPDLAALPLQAFDAGWDNAMFRLGEQLVVRLPRRQVAAALLEHEQTWLPQFAPQLPLPIPAPIRVGLPTTDYPWRWSVLPWLPGQAADLAEPHDHQAATLVTFLRALHRPAPSNAPVNPVRGVPLQQRAAGIKERMERLASKTDLITPTIRQLWQQALDAPVNEQARWLHGDLHARNVLVENGVITGIIDWGDVTAGDVATDLAALWMLFESPAARERAWAEYANGAEALRQRAQGWAVLFGVVLLETGLIDHPRHAAMGERTLRRVAEF